VTSTRAVPAAAAAGSLLALVVVSGCGAADDPKADPPPSPSASTSTSASPSRSASASTSLPPEPRGTAPNDVKTTTTTSALPVPEGGPDLKEPYASAWKAQRAKRLAALKAGKPLVDSSTLCLPEGMPTIMGAIFPIEILQTPRQVTVLAEFLTQTRRIYLDKPMPPVEEIAPSYYGFSSGHWSGDTLDVITRGVRKEVEFFEIPHSDQMTITEHLRLVGPKLLENKVVIDDPAYLKKPYAFTIGYRRKDDYRIMEYICDAKKDLISPDGTVSMKVEDDKR